MTSQQNFKNILASVEEIMRKHLSDFAVDGKTGMVQIDIQISNGHPTAITDTARNNKKLTR